ncbi:helix-turn-helix transcriptional regulator [Plantactinospora soyae]|uniref:AraC-like DNA-binding protein n=1 Tax=Plantactinospora soyae TaxID=1544732 RepID=A0A927M0T8_9ACTN|nr:AraC family transcriptional regulator [Plantactinospora soyae]MBE1484707.1 AraC-like DNA-binding protein [Plantactinospora soyae]
MRTRVVAWRPAVAGIAEVFHAAFVDHAYPVHTHDAWALLIVDDGAIRYDLDRTEHGALGGAVTVLPPHVAHDGRAATRHGFRKRVLYLDTSVLGVELTGSAVDGPSLRDPELRDRVDRLHRALVHPGDAFEAESRLAFVRERLYGHLRRRGGTDPAARGSGALADRLRALLDERTVDGVALREAAELLRAHPTHLVRSFSRRYGLPPHRYLTGRRVELARGLLLAGMPPAEVALAAGFYDQSHLTRHFRRQLGVGPARFADPARPVTISERFGVATVAAEPADGARTWPAE